MANDLFRELTSIVRGYINPFLAEILIIEICERCGTSEDDISAVHLPEFMLAMSTNQKLLGKLRSHEFTDMMKKITALSNRLEEMDRKRMKEFVNNYKNHNE